MHTFLSSVHESCQSSLDNCAYRQDDDDDDDDYEDNNEKTDDDCLSHKAKEDFTIEGERNYFIYFVICYFYFYLFLKL